MYVNKGCNLESPYILTVFSTVPTLHYPIFFTLLQGLQNLACTGAVFFNDVTRSWKYHSYFLDNSFQNQSKTNGTAQNEIHKIGQILLEPF